MDRINTLISDIRDRVDVLRTAFTGSTSIPTAPTSTDTGESIAKTMRYWHRAMTPDQVWKVMKKRGYTKSVAARPPSSLRTALKTDERFVQVAEGRFTLRPTAENTSE